MPTSKKQSSKKKYILPLAGATGLAVYLGLTQLAASKFTDQIAQLEEIIAQEANLQLIKNSHTRNFFTSTGEIELAIVLEDDLEVLVSAPWQAVHKAGWVNFVSDLNFTAQTRSDFNQVEELFNLNELFNLPDITVRGTASKDKLTYSQQFAKLNTQVDNLSVAIDNWLVAGNLYYADNNRETGKLSFDKLAINFADVEELNINNLAINYNQQGEFPWQTADWKINFKEAELKVLPTQLNLGASQVDINYQLNQQEFNLGYKLDIDTAHLNNPHSLELEVDSIALDTQVSQIDGQAMAELLTHLKSQTSNLAKGKNSALTSQQLKQLLTQILMSSPKLDVHQASFNLTAPAMMQMNPSLQGFVEFKGDNLPDDFLDLIEYGVIDEEEVQQRVELEARLKNLPTLIADLLGLPTGNSNTHHIKLSQGKLSINNTED